MLEFLSVRKFQIVDEHLAPALNSDFRDLNNRTRYVGRKVSRVFFHGFITCETSQPPEMIGIEFNY